MKQIVKPLFLVINKLTLFQHLNLTSRYQDDPLFTYIPYFEGKMGRIYPSKLQLNKAHASDTEALFVVLHLSIPNGLFHPKFMINAITF